MPSKRIQTIISNKGLVTLPGPYRSFLNLLPKDKIAVYWNKYVVIIPKKLDDVMTEDEKIMMNAFLEDIEPKNLIALLWEKLDQSDQDELLMELTHRARATLNVMECCNCGGNIDSGYRDSMGSILCNTCAAEQGLPRNENNKVWRL